MVRNIQSAEVRCSLRCSLTLIAILGFAHWFFGNLYEAVVFSPNWVVDSPRQMTRLNEFFVNTSPSWYFVPLTFGATALVWALLATNRDETLARHYRWAGFFALLSALLNAFIVATVVTKLFGRDYSLHSELLSSYCWHWNVLNVCRMVLVATTAAHLFSAFRRLDRP